MQCHEQSEVIGGDQQVSAVQLAALPLLVSLGSLVEELGISYMDHSEVNNLTFTFWKRGKLQLARVSLSHPHNHSALCGSFA